MTEAGMGSNGHAAYDGSWDPASAAAEKGIDPPSEQCMPDPSSPPLRAGPPSTS